MSTGTNLLARKRWTKLKPPLPPMCDICGAEAVYEHPAGGRRCAHCPRPTK